MAFVMKRNWLLPLFLLFTLRCASPTKQESEITTDTATATASVATEPVSTPNEEADEGEYLASIDLEEFTKHPFENDYPYIKNALREDSIEFTIIARDTIHSEQRTIQFDNSRIEFLDSDPAYQDELGDLICSSDIYEPKFRFNQDIVIGMPQSEFLIRAGLSESSLLKDGETDSSYYYEH